MSVETGADAVLVFPCPQLVCECDPCLWRLVLMLSLCFPALSWCVNLIHVCGDLFLCYHCMFSCPQSVCELDPCLWRLVLMLSLCFPALSRCVTLIHVCGNLYRCCPCVFLLSVGVCI